MNTHNSAGETDVRTHAVSMAGSSQPGDYCGYWSAHDIEREENSNPSDEYAL